MLSRIISHHCRTHLRLLSLTLSPSSPSSLSPSFFPQIPKLPFPTSRFYSTHDNGGNDQKPTSHLWQISQNTDNLDDIFGAHDGNLTNDAETGQIGSNNPVESGGESWRMEESGGKDGGVFEEVGGGESGEKEWLNAVAGDAGSEFQPWKLGEEEGGRVEDVFGDISVGGAGDGDGGDGGGESKEEREMVSAAEKLQLDKEEQSLLQVLEGPNCAFGDLVAASGITDDMLDSLIALKNFQGIQGLPPLAQIEDERYEKTFKKSDRYEMELRKQEEMAKARVRKVDEKGRAYGTGRRKCSIARVWIEPGEGKFVINDKEFDLYFPMLDHRAALLSPFSETKTLGLWDVKCTVKGGGVSGQVGAIRLGISRALQNWEPGLRPPLKEAGFLTRDPRVVERKKPGKAKARKSFQWVKR